MNCPECGSANWFQYYDREKRALGFSKGILTKIENWTPVDVRSSYSDNGFTCQNCHLVLTPQGENSENYYQLLHCDRQLVSGPNRLIERRRKARFPHAPVHKEIEFLNQSKKSFRPSHIYTIPAHFSLTYDEYGAPKVNYDAKMFIPTNDDMRLLVPNSIQSHLKLYDVDGYPRRTPNGDIVTSSEGVYPFSFETIRRIAEVATEVQKNWLSGGEPKVPLQKQELAKKAGVHISTISRLSSFVRIQTPSFGVIFLDELFEGGIACTPNLPSTYMRYVRENQIGTTLVKEWILDLIKEHEVKIPDQKIAEILSDRGVAIARRTVAKYKGALIEDAKIWHVIPMNYPQNSDFEACDQDYGAIAHLRRNNVNSFEQILWMGDSSWKSLYSKADAWARESLVYLKRAVDRYKAAHPVVMQEDYHKPLFNNPPITQNNVVAPPTDANNFFKNIKPDDSLDAIGLSSEVTKSLRALGIKQVKDLKLIKTEDAWRLLRLSKQQAAQLFQSLEECETRYPAAG